MQVAAVAPGRIMTPRMQEAEIVSGCRRGDAAARRELAVRFYDPVYRVARALVGDPHAAEDLTQDTFRGALKAVEAFRGESGILTWLVAILRRTWMAQARRPAKVTVGPIEDGPAPEPRERTDLSGVLAKLDEDERVLLTLFHYEERRYAEIARVLGIPVGTVKSRLHAARRKVKQLVEHGL